MRILEDDKCRICGKERESVKHLMCYCSGTKSIFREIGEQIQEFRELTWETVFKNDVHPEPCNYRNLLLLIVKQHIYASVCKQEKPRIVVIRNELDFIHDLQQKSAIKSGKVNKYNSIWEQTLEKTQKTQIVKNNFI